MAESRPQIFVSECAGYHHDVAALLVQGCGESRAERVNRQYRSEFGDGFPMLKPSLNLAWREASLTRTSPKQFAIGSADCRILILPKSAQEQIQAAYKGVDSRSSALSISHV